MISIDTIAGMTIETDSANSSTSIAPHPCARKNSGLLDIALRIGGTAANWHNPIICRPLTIALCSFFITA